MTAATIRRLNLSIILIACMTLSACVGRGQDITYAESQEYLRTHGGNLKQIIAALEACKPVNKRQPGTLEIHVDEVAVDPPVCANNDMAPMLRIRAAAHDNGVQVLKFQMNSLGQVTEARFLLYAFGLGISGGGTWIVYEATPSNDAPILLDNDRDLRPLDEAPHHWFWVVT